MSSKRRNAGKAVIELSLNDRVSRGLRKLEKRFQTFGTNIAKIGAAGVLVGTTLAAAFVAPVNAASNLEETMNKFNVVFGDNAKEVKAWSDEFANQVGRSERQIAEFVSSNQDLFVPLGFDEDAATEISKRLTGLALDLASFNNLSDDLPFRDLQAAATGSGEVMKKYGVLVNEAAVKQQLLNDGLDPKTATNQQKVMARLAIIMAGTTAAQGDAIRSAGGYANQTKALLGTLEDLSAEIGGAILPQVTAFVGIMRQGATFVREFAANNAGMVKTVALGAIVIGVLGAALVATGLSLKVVGASIGGLLSVATALKAIFAALLSPLGLVTAAVAGVAAWFVTSTEMGQELVSKLGAGFKELFGIAERTFGGITNLLAAGEIEAAGELLWAGLKLLWLEGTKSLRDRWAQFVEGVKEAWINLGTLIVSAGTKTFNAINDAASHSAEFIVTSLQRAFFGIADVLQSIAIGILATFDAILSKIGLSIDAVVEKAVSNREALAAFGDEAIANVRSHAKEERQTRNAAVGTFLENLKQGQSDRLARVDGSADREIEANRKARAEARAAFDKMESAAQEVATVFDEEKKLVAKQLQPAAAGIGSLAAKGIQPQAILDARFASQQFGSDRNEEKDILRDIADSNRKIKDKVGNAGGVQAI